MLIQFFTAFLVICTLINGSLAQSSDRSAEEKAYRAAMQIAHPRQKVAALEAMLAKYPKGSLRVVVNRTILEILLDHAPEQKEQILAQANRLLNVVSESTRGNWYNTIAGMFLEKGILLEDAERFARESVEQLGDRKNLGQMQQIGAVAGRAVFASNVPRVATLGRIYLRRGKLKEAESLLQEAFAADATMPSALLGMGELAETKGDHQAALNYFAEAYLSGRGREPARKRLEAAYRKVYPDKANELEAWLDAKYRKDYPTPIKTERYTPTPARTNRIVLAEVFSGASCGPCVAADLAFEAAMKRYDIKELAVLMYHVHIPEVDPLANPASEARKEFYGLQIAPSAYVNGVLLSGIGGNRTRTEESFTKIKAVVEKGLEAPSEAALRISAMQQGAVIKVKVSVEKVINPSSHLRLHLALVEDEVRYTGANGLRFHPMVVRAMAGEKAEGFPLAADKPVSFEHTFDLQTIEASTKAYLDDYEINGRTLPTKFDEKKHEIDRNRLSIVTFIQDNKTKQILQAVYLKLPSAVETRK